VKRLFIGLEVPAICGETLAQLDPGIRGLRWLPAEQLHLTLSFLGGVTESEAGQLKEALTDVADMAVVLSIGQSAFVDLFFDQRIVQGR
jgi:2'-5' RNA ligase